MILENVIRLVRSGLGAIAFYTMIPVPNRWKPDFTRIARWAPGIGLLMGILLSLGDALLYLLQMPILTRSGLIVALWVGITGGIHLDGVMDTADGLGVQDPQRRLTVMRDSVTGAFGVMAGILVLLLKTLALSDLSSHRGLSLMLASGWGRWGQVMAIALYPYLRPQGKGAFHQQGLKLPHDSLLGLGGLLFLCGFMGKIGIALIGIGSAIALFTGFYFYRCLGGQTGDTYGAVVEWTEAIFLCGCTVLL